ncbi:uncharacterized protein [Nicotiana sylvestris]|uniref:Uncharacterized protein LOC104244095 n=1 Tax=Nicotiana sylvestris TaxID=4096 RepID=A0A1U7YEN4_NICSY|nr:PREDICTED: uncharacterized protein LOC104244095 [Nicotiana sylvestris]
MEDLMNAFIIKTDERLETHSADIRNLERNGKVLQDLWVEEKNELTENQVKNEGKQKSDKHSRNEVRAEQENDLKKNNKSEIPTRKKKEKQRNNDEIEESKYMPTLPFPQKQRREKLDEQFGHFLEVLKYVHVNIPFTEVFSLMPTYAKFLNEILSNKRKVEETSMVKLTEHCSTILQNKLRKNKLEGKIGEIRSIPMSLQLADQTTMIPEGIVEDVLVRVDKFVFPVDFIVVNMEENREVLLILGRSFLATGRAIMDIQER